MTASNDPIADGKAAWQRLKTNARTSWADWVLIARALEVGRSESLKIALTSSPVGTRYNSEMGRWLREHDLADIPAQARYRALQCLKHLPAIEAWRESIPDAHRRKFNHPNSVWSRWQNSLNAETTRQRQNVVTRVAPKAAKRVTCTSIRWPQSTIKRAGDAMRQAWSNDVYKLATIALQAAIRSEVDLLELLPDPPAKPAPRSNGAPARYWPVLTPSGLI
jgi:hypothetical protein